jgi:outer membrane receptor protein involved in Fe transport
MGYKYWTSCCLAALASGLATSAATAQTNAAGPGIADIIVTAQRRDESIQKVPETIQAFGGEALSKLDITNLDELLKFTPNVVYSAPGAGQGQITVRGLSTGRAGEQSFATVGNFPNVAVYLDDASMQFPGRSPDIFLADMQRVEILEGPQGTLFGGGAEAGALRYITNKPKLNVYEGRIEGSYGYTEHGDNNNSVVAMVNLPVISDKLAVRGVYYNDTQGGYIDNVPSTFTRNEQLDNNSYIGIRPTNGFCPDGGRPSSTGFCGVPNSPRANNYAIAKSAQNPVNTQGARIEALYKVAPDWEVLISQSVQNLDAEGLSTSYPSGSDFQPLKPLEVTSFVPTYNKDNFESTAWTLSGKLDSLSLIYTGSYTDRHVVQQNDYTNYSRTLYGQYYECTGGNNSGFGAGKASGPAVPATCYSPVTYWHDKVHNTHLSNEFRVSTPSDWRLRGVAGVFYEQFRINDVMNFEYKTIPSCDQPGAISAQQPALGLVCVGNDQPAPGSTGINPSVRDDMTGYGEDIYRGYDQTAFFLHLDFDIIPKVLTVSAGTRRYEYDEFEKGSVYHTATNCTGVLVCPYKANIDAEHLSSVYRGFKSEFGAQWHPTSNLNFYYTYSEGFRPGGFNRYSETKAPYTSGNNQFIKNVSYKPDYLKNNEIGAKTDFFQHRLQLNVSAYYMKWLDTQIALYQPCCLGNSTFTTNGANYTIKGVEFQTIARPVDGLTIQGSISYNDDRQANSPCLIANAPTAPFPGQCITQVKGQPYPNPFGVIGGAAPYSPLVKMNLVGRYDWEMQAFPGFRNFVSLNGDFATHTYNEPSNYISGDSASQIVPNTTYLRYLIPGYAILGGSMGFAKDQWTVTLFGTNLLNSHVSTFTSSGQFIKAETPLRPRVIDLHIARTF